MALPSCQRPLNPCTQRHLGETTPFISPRLRISSAACIIEIQMSAAQIILPGRPVRRQLIKYIVMIIAFWILVFVGSILLTLYMIKGQLGPNTGNP